MPVKYVRLQNGEEIERRVLREGSHLIFPALGGDLIPLTVRVNGNLFTASVLSENEHPEVVVEAIHTASYQHLHFDDSYIAVES